MTFEEVPCGGERFAIIEIPHGSGFRVACGHGQIGQRLAQSPIRVLFAKFSECGQQFRSYTVVVHNFSPTVGNAAMGTGKSSIT